MATPTARSGAPPAGAAHATASEAEVQHIYSVSPLLIGIGLMFLYIGFEWVLVDGIPVFLLLGVVFFGAGIVNWIREDVHFWNVNWTDHGVLPGETLEWWGILFFLGTEVMLFGGLFAMYFVGRGEDAVSHTGLWQGGHSHLDVVGTGINTAILILSSVTYHLSEHSIKRDNRRMQQMWGIITFILGAIFLVRQILEYRSLINDGFLISTNMYWSSFYMLTGTHGAHVTFGLLLILIGLVRSFMGHFDAERHEFLRIAGMYWHFVDIVWIFLFSVLYLQVV
ncbi:MAG: cytochrome c oxidase subunit 3 [Thermoplasmatota archaeon]